jgi:hypothetical protein
MADQLNYETLGDLVKLIGEYENERLEFKSSRLFYPEGKPSKNYIDKISKEVSGFANTNGGHLIVGFETQKTGNEPDKAIGLDEGITYSDFNPESIQRAINASISPPLYGIRYLPIKTKENENKYYLVIAVPKGDTAYQSKDRIYYGRETFETIPLHDSHIRLLMTKAKEPHAAIVLSDLKIEKENAPEDKVIRNKYSFKMYLKNDGEINITEFKLVANIQDPIMVKIKSFGENAGRLCSEAGDTYTYQNGWPAPIGSPHEISEINFDNPNSRSLPIAVDIFPEDNYFINDYKLIVQYPTNETEEEFINRMIDVSREGFSKQGILSSTELELAIQGIKAAWENKSNKRLLLRWKIFLHNTHPISNDIDLQELFKIPNFRSYDHE